jgi:hypothetical protein
VHHFHAIHGGHLFGLLVFIGAILLILGASTKEDRRG